MINSKILKEFKERFDDWEYIMGIIDNIENSGYQVRIEGIWSLGTKKIKGHHIKIWNEKEDIIDNYYNEMTKKTAVIKAISEFLTSQAFTESLK